MNTTIWPGELRTSSTCTYPEREQEFATGLHSRFELSEIEHLCLQNKMMRGISPLLSCHADPLHGIRIGRYLLVFQAVKTPC